MSYYVRMTDNFLSGWGPATGKRDVLVVTCDTWDQAYAIREAARHRSEMKRVKIIGNVPKYRADCLYTHKHYKDLGDCWKSYYGKNYAV